MNIKAYIHIGIIFLLIYALSNSVYAQSIGKYKVFEGEVMNARSYSNKFTDVTLNVQYQAPSGKLYDFFGFFDGDTTWKFRFMPDEVGEWKYIYSWSDGKKGGKGSFNCTTQNTGKGILQPFQNNPRWLAYNGQSPVWLKSYYETGHGSLGQDFEWVVENVYQPLYENGYNHLQVNWLLSLCCFGQYYKDGPEPETLDLALYEQGDIWGSMSIDVWSRMEEHLGWLNDHDMGVHMFLGVDGSKNDGPEWTALSYEEQDAYVKYMVARLAPYANLAGWNFVWEVPGDREEQELRFIRLVQKYDIFNHLRTYEDEMPRDNEFARPEYTFAAVENHKIASDDKELERHLWKEPWLHHMACLVGYKGKPVYMSEGNALWRRYWQERTQATQDDLRRAAWACATAGAYFNWNGHASEYDLYVNGPEGLPFNEENPYIKSENAISILTRVMNDEVEFYRMGPADKLLKNHRSLEVYALAEPGAQYLVFSTDGEPFSLELQVGEYRLVKWIDTQTGKATSVKNIVVKQETELLDFQPPNTQTDWVLVIKN